MARLRSLYILGISLFWASLLCASEPEQESVQLFESKIRPLLEKCIKCHGPDKQEARLRLDTPGGLMTGSDSGRVVVPGDPARSRLVQLVRGTKELTMPPDKKLAKSQIAVLEQWVKAGAVWPRSVVRIKVPQNHSNHRAFQPISHPKLPAMTDTSSVRNPIDRFIRRRLELGGLKPSAETDKTTLLRRVTLDLTGLPPSLDETVAFLNDTLPGAYERSVDRLLASPHFGERWGRHWLDGARYADSEGNEGDQFRSVWAYREWVINALNGDMPFDQFVTEQIAGDLMQGATQEQRIATAFYRNNIGASRLQAVVDRVNTTGTVFMGLTVGCAQCHSHKFDPVSQREYYELFAFFNNSDDPVLKLGTREWART